MFPIRCYSCNRCIADRYQEFSRLRKEAQQQQQCQAVELVSVGAILDDMRIRCSHCRLILMTYLEPAAVQFLLKQS